MAHMTSSGAQPQPGAGRSPEAASVGMGLGGRAGSGLGEGVGGAGTALVGAGAGASGGGAAVVSGSPTGRRVSGGSGRHCCTAQISSSSQSVSLRHVTGACVSRAFTPLQDALSKAAMTTNRRMQ